MKIFNQEPIKVNEYTFNEEHLAESRNGCGKEFGFEFTCDVVDSLNTLIVEFDILCTVGDKCEEIIIPSDNPNVYTKSISIEAGSGDVLLSYNSSCRFNFENEGFDADVLTLTDFLEEYYKHIKEFLNTDRFEPAQRIDREGTNYSLKGQAIRIIDNLRANNMYEF